MLDFNPDSTQTGHDSAWESGRCVDMDAFDKLPRSVRDHLNENLSFFPIEDVLYEHASVFGGDESKTLDWLRANPLPTLH